MERYRDRQTTGKNDAKKRQLRRTHKKAMYGICVTRGWEEMRGRNYHSLALAGWSLVSNKEHQSRAQSTATRTGNSVIIR